MDDLNMKTQTPETLEHRAARLWQDYECGHAVGFAYFTINQIMEDIEKYRSIEGNNFLEDAIKAWPLARRVDELVNEIRVLFSDLYGRDQPISIQDEELLTLKCDVLEGIFETWETTGYCQLRPFVFVYDKNGQRTEKS